MNEITCTIYRCPDCGTSYDEADYRGPRHAPETFGRGGWGLGCSICGGCGPFEREEDELPAE